MRFEVWYDGASSAQVFVYDDREKAERAAMTICKEHKVEVRVLQTLTIYRPEPRAIDCTGPEFAT
jgi:hypothetical protein